MNKTYTDLRDVWVQLCICVSEFQQTGNATSFTLRYKGPAIEKPFDIAITIRQAELSESTSNQEQSDIFVLL